MTAERIQQAGFYNVPCAEPVHAGSHNVVVRVCHGTVTDPEPLRFRDALVVLGNRKLKKVLHAAGEVERLYNAVDQIPEIALKVQIQRFAKPLLLCE